MKAFLCAVIVAIGIGFISASVLETSQRTAEKQFSSTNNVRN
jgi:hypothetical protein